MKKVILFILIIIFLTYFLYPRFTHRMFPQEEFAILQVESEPSGALVFLNEQELGITPWRSDRLEAGIYTIKLIFSGSNFTKTASWVDKVSLETGTKTKVSRILSPTLFFSGGYVLFYQKIENGGKKTALAALIEQGESKVYWDDQEKGVTPLLIEDFGLDSHNLRFEKEDYQSMEVYFEPKEGFLSNFSVELIPDLKNKIEKIEDAKIEKDSDVQIGGKDIIKRSDWGSPGVELSPKQLRFSPWTKLEVYALLTDISQKRENVINITDWIQSFSFYVQEILHLSELPFCYLISEEGEIFEGLGVRDFDFSSLSEAKGKEAYFLFENLKFFPGICPVVYLTSEKKELSPPARLALEKLLDYLNKSAVPSGKLITVLNQIEASSGQAREITLEFQNIGDAVWREEGPQRIVLVTNPPGRASELYTKESWIAVDQVALPDEEWVLPGEVATFTFPITVPYYPGQIDESFVLWDQQQKVIVEGTKASLSVEVGGEGMEAVEIKETPTGFLNVRNGPKNSAELIGTVYPGEKYLFLEEQEGWFKIKLRDGSEGWVFARYVEKQ